MAGFQRPCAFSKGVGLESSRIRWAALALAARTAVQRTSTLSMEGRPVRGPLRMQPATSGSTSKHQGTQGIMPPLLYINAHQGGTPPGELRPADGGPRRQPRHTSFASAAAPHAGRALRRKAPAQPGSDHPADEPRRRPKSHAKIARSPCTLGPVMKRAARRT